MELKSMKMTITLLLSLFSLSYAQFSVERCTPKDGKFLGKAKYSLDTLLFISYGNNQNELKIKRVDCFYQEIGAFDIDEKLSIYFIFGNELIKYTKNGKKNWAIQLSKPNNQSNRISNHPLDIKYLNGKVYVFMSDFINHKLTLDIYSSENGKLSEKIDLSQYISPKTIAGGPFFYRNILSIERLELIEGSFPIKLINLNDLIAREYEQSKILSIIMPESGIYDYVFLSNMLFNKPSPKYDITSGYAGQSNKFIIFDFSCAKDIMDSNCPDKNIYEWWLLDKRNGNVSFIAKEDSLNSLSLFGTTHFQFYDDTKTVFLTTHRIKSKGPSIPNKTYVVLLNIKSN